MALKASLQQGRSGHGACLEVAELQSSISFVVGAEAPRSSEHPNAGGAARSHSGFTCYSPDKVQVDVAPNSSPLALIYVVCIAGVLAGQELPAWAREIGSWPYLVDLQWWWLWSGLLAWVSSGEQLGPYCPAA